MREPKKPIPGWHATMCFESLRGVDIFISWLKGSPPDWIVGSITDAYIFNRLVEETTEAYRHTRETSS